MGQPFRAANSTSSDSTSRTKARPHAKQNAQQHGPQIVSPADGSTYLIDPTLRAEFQTLPLRAVAARGPLEWRVDGRIQPAARDEGDVHWPLRRGRHRVMVRDARGQQAEVTIVVK